MQSFNGVAHRPVVMGATGMVSSAHPLASLSGIQILANGGNAFDAAVAIASTLNVVEPYMSGVGGIGVALAYVAADNMVRSLDFSGRTPFGAKPCLFNERVKKTGMLAPLVPGNVAGWLTLHEAYGRLDRERLFQSAINYAKEGFPITHFNSYSIAASASRLALFPSGSIILNKQGKPPGPGKLLRMPALAESLIAIAKDGADTFYRGELAERIVKGNQRLGGLFTLDDLASYEPRWNDPISISYRGYQVYTAPPNSTGFQVLQTLKLMEGFHGDELTPGDPETLHLLMESVKLCVTDRTVYAGDPDHVRIPLNGLLSENYSKIQRTRINRESASWVVGEHYVARKPRGSLAPGSLEEFDGGMTTHFAVADRDGNVVTVTQTLGGAFGCAAAVGDTGIFLNNMNHWFDLEVGSPNRIGPGKRVGFCLSPTQTLKDGRFYASLGTPGSWGILQTTPQCLINLLDHGMNLQAAIEAPRFRYYAGRHVEMEGRFPTSVINKLTKKGHEIRIINQFDPSVGGAQAIQLDIETGAFHGGADPRRDGYAIGL